MKASDNLTWLAEVILDQVLAMAWQWMLSRHGSPGKESSEDPDPGLLVVGYGKMGGIELGHSSDLDLVLMHNANPNLATDGEKPIDNATFFNRLGQRMVHILTTQTVSGDLYEVDMRLRPNGNSGLLVPTFVAYEKYIQQDAWTWELQALVRARPVAGDGNLAIQFEQSRRAVLCLSRNEETLKKDVTEMRDKMRTHLGSGNQSGKDAIFQLKQDAGGIVDIEFVVQYLVLLHSHSFPELVEYSDNMRILDAIKSNALLPAVSVTGLQDAYIFFRSLGHRLSLQGNTNTIEQTNPFWLEANTHREQVVAIWEEIFKTV